MSKPVHPKGNQFWIFIGRTDAEAETSTLWPLDGKNWFIWKDPDAGKDWRWKENGTTEDEMVGWHHQLDGHEFEWTPGVGDGQRGLACCSPWGHKESDTTERLNWLTDCHRLHCVKWNKPDTERKLLHDVAYEQKLRKWNTQSGVEAWLPGAERWGKWEMLVKGWKSQLCRMNI